MALNLNVSGFPRHFDHLMAAAAFMSAGQGLGKYVKIGKLLVIRKLGIGCERRNQAIIVAPTLV